MYLLQAVEKLDDFGNVTSILHQELCATFESALRKMKVQRTKQSWETNQFFWISDLSAGGQNRPMWEFTADGRQTSLCPLESRSRKIAPLTAKFGTGDLLFIRPTHEFPFSGYPFGKHAVVRALLPEEGVLELVLIGSLGFLINDFQVEDALTNECPPLRKELEILKILAAHYSGQNPLSEPLIDSLYRENVYVLNNPSFDFISNKILNAEELRNLDS